MPPLGPVRNCRLCGRDPRYPLYDDRCIPCWPIGRETTIKFRHTARPKRDKRHPTKPARRKPYVPRPKPDVDAAFIELIRTTSAQHATSTEAAEALGMTLSVYSTLCRRLKLMTATQRTRLEKIKRLPLTRRDAQ